jgi:hypothetical protein
MQPIRTGRLTAKWTHGSAAGERFMTSSAVQLQQLDSIPLAVIRRQVSSSELSRVVPECCGLVWNAVRAQEAKAGRNVAVYSVCWDGKIRLEVGVELDGPFAEWGGCPFGNTSWCGGVSDAFRALWWPRRCARRRSTVVQSQQSQACGSKLGDLRSLAERVEYGSVADSYGRLLSCGLRRGGSAP